MTRKKANGRELTPAAANITFDPATANQHEIKAKATDRVAATGVGRRTEILSRFDDLQDDVDGVSVTARFEQFHRRNPHFYTALVDLAREFKARAGRGCGVQRLVEVVRHDIELTATADDEFKINNSFAPYYARLIMLREPDLAEFFRLRSAPEADVWIASMAAGRWAA